MNFIRLITAIFFSVLFFNNSFALDCNRTISAAVTEQYSCVDDDSLTVTGSIIYNNENAVLATQKDNVTVSNSGTIKVTAEGGSLDSPIQGQSSLNLTVTNSGTIWAQDDYGIKLIEAEKVTITNEAGGTIKGTPTSSGSQIAIGGTKMGNCGTCINGSTTSSGEGLTLYNYGTIDSDSRTVYGGHASGHTSKKTKIYNYNGGMIDATSTSAIKFQYAEDFELYNYSGATIQTGTGNYAVDLKGASTITIDNAGTIKPGGAYGIFCDLCSNITITNSGNIEATSDALFLRDMTGINTITNSGTIKNTSGGRATQFNGSTGVTLINTGTIESATQVAVGFLDNVNPTLKNWGTIKSTANKSKVVDFPQTDGTGTGGTLENYGTIISSTGSTGQAIRVGDGTATWDDLKIINSGTISSVGESVLVSGGSGTTGLNITTKGEGTWVGEIDMEDAAVTMTLDCSISKDQDIEIEDKTNMVVVNNLCGNDTYAILDSSKNADADNSETNGYIRIYGEDLDIDSNNKKYRTEIFLAKLNNIFSSTDENKEQSTYYSRQKRDDIYKNYENGILGFFEKKDQFSFLEKPFISYSDQRASFNNYEYTGSKNLAIGTKQKIELEDFNLSIVPVVGLSQNQIIDIETETNQRLEKYFTSQFAGINASLSKKIDFTNDSNLTLEVNGTYGLHRLPKYITNFTDGDLSVDDAIDQVLGAGFNVRHSKENTNGFILEPYVGLSLNNTLSNDVEIIADGENKEAGHVMNGVLAKTIGFDLTKNTENFTFAINFNHQDQDGLIGNTASISLSKKIQQISKLRKERERKIPELEKLFDQLQLAKENERLAEIAGKAAKENEAMKALIIELIKENQKLKTENKIFKKN
jgi:hypothetical protein